MIKNITIALFSSLLLMACGKEKSTGDGQTGGATGTSFSQSFYDCILQKETDYTKIFSKDDLLKLVSISDPASIKTDDKSSRSSHKYIDYQWPSGRPPHTIKVGSLTQDIPDNNFTNVANFVLSRNNEAKTLEDFNRSYKKISEEEFKQMLANIEANFKDKTKEEKEQAIRLLEIRKNLEYHHLPDVGTTAYWEETYVNGNNLGIELYVLAGKITFKVSVKVSDEAPKNAETAKAIAQFVIGKCQ